MKDPISSTRYGSMKTSIFVFGLILSMGVALPSRSEDIPQHDEVTNLSLQMSEMNLAMRRLRKLVKGSDKKAEALRVILNVQLHALHAKGLTPSTIASTPPAQQADALLDYRKRMIELLETLLKLEKEVLANDFESAQQTYSDLWGLADDGHKKFRADIDED